MEPPSPDEYAEGPSTIVSVSGLNTEKYSSENSANKADVVVVVNQRGASFTIFDPSKKIVFEITRPLTGDSVEDPDALTVHRKGRGVYFIETTFEELFRLDEQQAANGGTTVIHFLQAGRHTFLEVTEKNAYP